MKRRPRRNPDPAVDLYRYLKTEIDPYRLEHLLEAFYEAAEVPRRRRRDSLDGAPADLVISFSNWLAESASSDLPAQGEDGPAYLFLHEPELVRGGAWLAHFTHRENILSILEDGLEGVEDMDDLPFTGGRSHSGEGWAYAYVPELDEHEASDGYADAEGGVFGDAALLFQAPAVRVMHTYDEEPQALVWAPAVREAVLVEKAEKASSDWAVRDRRSRRVLVRGDFDRVAAWVRDHADGYRRAIMRRVGS
jgi:hypothetical protein